MIASRATVENAMFWALSSALRADRRAARHRLRVVERPLQHLHAAERAAERGVQARDPEVVEQPPVDGVRGRATLNIGNSQPVAAGRSPGRSTTGPVVPWQPPSRFGADDEEAVGVDRLARGRSARSHQPRRAGSPWWPAACASPVSAWQTKTAFDAVRRRASRRSRRRPRPGRASRRTRRTSGSSSVKRTTRCVSTRPRPPRRHAEAAACERAPRRAPGRGRRGCRRCARSRPTGGRSPA